MKVKKRADRSKVRQSIRDYDAVDTSGLIDPSKSLTSQDLGLRLPDDRPTEEHTMSEHPWVRKFPGAITVTDQAGTILELNDAAAAAFHNEGGRKLVGTNVLDCHPEPSRTRLQGIMSGRTTNVYTIQKKGKRKLIYQSPWYRDGEYAGFVELSLDIPWEMPHFVRD